MLVTWPILQLLLTSPFFLAAVDSIFRWSLLHVSPWLQLASIPMLVVASRSSLLDPDLHLFHLNKWQKWYISDFLTIIAELSSVIVGLSLVMAGLHPHFRWFNVAAVPCSPWRWDAAHQSLGVASEGRRSRPGGLGVGASWRCLRCAPSSYKLGNLLGWLLRW